MSTDQLWHMLLWCAVINYAVLLIWFAAFVVAHDAIYRLHTRWFRIGAAQFDALHYGTMAVYKVGIVLFNIAPLVALFMVTPTAP